MGIGLALNGNTPSLPPSLPPSFFPDFFPDTYLGKLEILDPDAIYTYELVAWAQGTVRICGSGFS